jgi:hypothetical protein
VTPRAERRRARGAAGWDLPQRRQLFAGVRLASDPEGLELVDVVTDPGEAFALSLARRG